MQNHFSFLPSDGFSELHFDVSGLPHEERVSLPNHSVEISVDGHIQDQTLFAMHVRFLDRKRAPTMALGQSRTFLTIFVHMSGTFVPAAPNPTFTATLSMTAGNNASLTDYYWWNRPYNLNSWYSSVTRGQFGFDRDLNKDGISDTASCVITPADLTTYDCTSIRNTANAMVVNETGPVTLYQIVAYVGPSGWICGGGLGVVGSSSSTFTWIALSGPTSTNTLFHELGHNM